MKYSRHTERYEEWNNRQVPTSIWLKMLNTINAFEDPYIFPDQSFLSSKVTIILILVTHDS